MRILRVFVLITIALLFTSPLLAFDRTSFSCGLSVVYLGDLETDVLKKCGRPTVDMGDRWVYEKGSSPMRVVYHFTGERKFERRVARIEVQDKDGRR